MNYPIERAIKRYDLTSEIIDAIWTLESYDEIRMQRELFRFNRNYPIFQLNPQFMELLPLCETEE